MSRNWSSLSFSASMASSRTALLNGNKHSHKFLYVVSVICLVWMVGGQLYLGGRRYQKLREGSSVTVW
jgi:hypothetical protein